MDASNRIAMLITIAETHVGGEGIKELEEAGSEAIRALHALSRLNKELVKMEQEVTRCYELARDNALCGLKKEATIWNTRAQAFRDMVAIINGIIGG